MLAVIFILLNIPLLYQLDPDFGWHYFLGKNISQSYQVVHDLIGYNNFSNLALPDHEWLSDFLLFNVVRLGGYGMLIVLTALLCLILFLLLVKICIKEKIDGLFVLISLALLSLPLSTTYGVRLQVLILVGAALLLFIARSHLAFWKKLLLYFFIFIAGINLHGGFLVLSVIPVLFEFKTEPIKGIKNSLAKVLILSSIILIATLINPYGLDYWKLVLEYGKESYYKTHITEWLPIYYPSILIEDIIHLSLVIFLLTIDGYWKKIKKNELLLIIFFLLMGIQYRRFYSLFAIIVTPYLAKSAQYFFENIKSSQRAIRRVAMTICGIVILALLYRIDFDSISTKPRDEKSYPGKALAYLDRNRGTEDVIFNDYAWGGYILWQSPERKVFIDGRGPQLKIDGKKTILEEYYEFFTEDPKKLSDLMDKYNITLVIIRQPQDTVYNFFDKMYFYLSGEGDPKAKPLHRNLVDNLNTLGWEKIYEDQASIIYRQKK